MQHLKLLFILLFLTLTSVALASVEHTKKQRVKTLVEQGVVMAISQGKESLIKQVNDRYGAFVKGDTYLFVGDLNKINVLAHPYHKELIGKDLSLFNDKNGSYMSFEFVKTALEEGAGWISYQWIKPGSKVESTKHTYIMKVPTKDYYVGAGYHLGE